jgi:3-deoxy-D-manno-octulosonic-acid transferase
MSPCGLGYDILVWSAVALNLVGAYLSWRGKREWKAITRQYQHYVTKLEAVVAQQEGRHG